MVAGSSSTDVAIVGGGVMGCSIALALRAHRLGVTVFEKGIPGAEASSAAAGILGAQVEAHAPGPLFELCLASRSLFPALVERLRELSGIDVEWRRSGVLRVAFDDAQLSEIRSTAEWQRGRGLEVELCNEDEALVKSRALSTDVRGAAFFAHDARIDPPRYLRALRIAAEREGVVFSSGRVVRKIAIASDRAEAVELESGDRVSAGAVVVAAGSWSGLVDGAHVDRGVVVPARGQIVELTTPSPLIDKVIFGPGVYLSPRDDGRLLLGSTLEFVGFERAVTAGAVAELITSAIALVPALRSAEFQRAWSNFRPYTKDELPIIGPAHVERLFLATGHYRNGILLSPITAEILASMVVGARAPIDAGPFAMRPFDLRG